MASEPDNKTTKLLTAYAKHRRRIWETQNASRPMPDWMRRRLFLEVERQHSSPPAAGEFFKRLFRFRPALAFTAMVSLIALIGVIVVVNNPPELQLAARDAGNQEDPVSAGEHTAATAPTTPAAPALAASDIESSGRSGEGGSAVQFSERQPAGLDSNATSVPRSARQEIQPIESFEGPAALAMRGPDVSAPLSTSNSVRFVQLPEIARWNETQHQTGAPILTSFDVQQNGNQIRVLDADGSIYSGPLGPIDPRNPSSQQPARAVAERVELLRTRSGQRRSRTAEPLNPSAIRPAADPDESQWFRAIGTNVSLQEVVVFEGNLFPPGSGSDPPNDPAAESSPALRTGSPAVRYRSPAPSSALRPVPPNQNQGLRIQGTARVGTNELLIDAAPPRLPIP